MGVDSKAKAQELRESLLQDKAEKLKAKAEKVCPFLEGMERYCFPFLPSGITVSRGPGEGR